MEAPDLFGQHRVCEDGDLVTLQFIGAAGLAETTAFHDLLARKLEGGGRCYILVDVAGLTGVDAATRRFIGEWSRKHKITAGAAYGASFSVRVLLTLMLNTIRLMSADPPDIVIARDEPEARRWLAARRAASSP